MKLPRDVGATELVAALRRLGYGVTRQTGSHLRLTCAWPRSHHLTIPNHRPLAVGTLSAILAELARERGVSKEELATQLFGLA